MRRNERELGNAVLLNDRRPEGGTLPEAVDVLVVGAGHAGLAMSSLLTHEGREHLVVERRDRVGGGWQDRWDEFTLVTPNWTASFPGWDYDGPDPDGFMGRDEIAARVVHYAERIGAPVALGTGVQRSHLRRAGLSTERPRSRRHSRPVLPRPPLAAVTGLGLPRRPAARWPAPRRGHGPPCAASTAHGENHPTSRLVKRPEAFGPLELGLPGGSSTSPTPVTPGRR
jgi:NAD(P)-binding Rossmann-like domain